LTRYGCEEARRLARTSRRELLRVGAAGALGLTLGDLLALRQAGAAAADESACIVLWLSGGPSQFDSFDPKSEAPAEIRGPFKPIETNVSGIRVCETFPKLARHADKYALLRSVHHGLDDHARGMCWMLAGRLHDTVNYPTMGSVVARLKPRHPQMPSFVTVPRIFPILGISETDHSQTAGDLGPAWNPVIPDGVPTEKGFGMRDLPLPERVDPGRFARREKLLGGVNRECGPEAQRSARADLGAAYRRAFELINSDRVRQAFDFEKEPASVRDRYGRHAFGQTVLLARRVVEAGARFVTVNWPTYYAWDHHGGIEGGMKSLAPLVDSALSALLEDLQQRGMLQKTLVICMGEFGRTPVLNKDAGRDHWVHVMSVLMAGGGIRGGQVVGSSTNDGYPNERPIHAREMVATAYAALGIDTSAEVQTVIGRPIQVLPGVEPVRELL